MKQRFNLNQILDALPLDELVRLSAGFELVPRAANQPLFRHGDAVDYVVFPLTAVVSLLYLQEDGKNVEIGLVGREGLVGLPALLGPNKAIYSAEVLVPGQAIKARASALKMQCETSEALCQQVMLQSWAHLLQFSRLSACNLCHHIPERVCRWLLMLQDRTRQDEFHLTQERIAERLGIRRAGVTVQFNRLEQLGAIQARRAWVKILDRSRLEVIACRCYQGLAEKPQSVAVRPPVAENGAGSAKQWWPQQAERTSDQPPLHYA
jgi:CRP-like cAMP-binding protein